MAFIIKPLITEKMTNITEKSSVDRTYKPKTGKHRGEEVTKKAQPKYGFIVKPQANKIEIAKEVEAMYNVTVENVNTLRYAGKRSSRYTKAGLVRGQDTRLLARSRILLHPCQRSLSFTVSVLPVVETTLVR